MKDFSIVDIETITPDDEYDYFFAYYDLQPYDKESKRHLAHRVKFHDRIPNADDIAEIGYITLDEKSFTRLPRVARGIFSRAVCFSGLTMRALFTTITETVNFAV